MIHSYAGIGSRSITNEEYKTIKSIAGLMKRIGFLLYSGNAEGADNAFQEGSEFVNVSYLPWDGFNSFLKSAGSKCVTLSAEGLRSVDTFHPNPRALTQSGRRLMARNYNQVMGIGLLPKVDLVICCAFPTEAGVSGGTGQAIRIAIANNIPYVNIRESGWMEKLKSIVTCRYEKINMDDVDLTVKGL